jgi:predicted negative regulator of RcsB-dependent stress response
MANKARTQAGTQAAKAKEANPLDKIQVWYEKNKKPLNTATTLVVVAAALVFAYLRLYKAPREEKSATALSYAQRYFAADSLNLALNGDGQHQGFLKIENKFSGTDAANLCHYYAGICYLHMGDFNNAIKQLKDFNGKGTMLEYAAWGNLGDAYMENNNTAKGIEYYEKAIGNKDDIVLTPVYLLRLGMAYEMMNKTDDAKKAYKRIQDEFPMSMQARDVDKYLARLGELN